MTNKRIVALGGGHGLAATLSSLRQLTNSITAIVTVADNGGSSGRLRDEFPILPPGDLRMALAALCSDDEWGRSWAEIMQYRFTSQGEMNGHAIGNLLLAALWSRGEDPVAVLDRVGTLLKAVGRVLPMAAVPLDIEATFNTPTGRIVVRGQKEVATTRGRIESLRILPENPPACPEALDAISHAEWIILGPGSWLSSVISHLLVPVQCRALEKSSAKKIVILNLDGHPGTYGQEFAGSTPEEHLEILHYYAPNLQIDCILADSSVVRDKESLRTIAARCGGQIVVRDIRKGPGSARHDVNKLASHLDYIFNETEIG